jgi:hypothetical protein
MPFTVTTLQRGDRYRISVGDGSPVTAQNFNELGEALRHYYGRPSHYAARREDICPFCRAAREALIAHVKKGA